MSRPALNVDHLLEQSYSSYETCSIIWSNLFNQHQYEGGYIFTCAGRFSTNIHQVLSTYNQASLLHQAYIKRLSCSLLVKNVAIIEKKCMDKLIFMLSDVMSYLLFEKLSDEDIKNIKLQMFDLYFDFIRFTSILNMLESEPLDKVIKRKRDKEEEYLSYKRNKISNH
jgi:hypothetical protein